MIRVVAIVVVVLSIAASAAGCASRTRTATGHVANYLYTSIGDFDTDAKPLVDSPDIEGVQVVVPWRMLEPQKGDYDFTAIEQTLNYVTARGKKLFVQLQDRFFSLPARVPKYLLTDPEYSGGVATTKNENGLGTGPPGAVAAQWKDPVRQRFQHLMDALAQKFDGRLAGVNLPETAVEIDLEKDTTGFTCDTYFDSALDNISHARKVFTKSAVVQYTNFWPCEWNNDHRYMERAFELANARGIGMGGPDVLPNRPAQMQNSYPFFKRDKTKLSLVAVAVQEPDFEYVNPQTKLPFTKKEFTDFAINEMGAQIIFWATSAPWLHSH